MLVLHARSAAAPSSSKRRNVSSHAHLMDTMVTMVLKDYQAQNAGSAQPIATHVSMEKHACSVLTPCTSSAEYASRLAQRGIMALARVHWAAPARHAMPVAKRVPAPIHAQSARMLSTSAVANVMTLARPQPIRMASNELGVHANPAV